MQKVGPQLFLFEYYFAFFHPLTKNFSIREALEQDLKKTRGTREVSDLLGRYIHGFQIYAIQCIFRRHLSVDRHRYKFVISKM